MIKSSGKNAKPSYTESRKGDVMHSLGDCSNMREKLKFVPKKSLEDGLKETSKWFGL
jgi:UDP-glucose 4-epimerase